MEKSWFDSQFALALKAGKKRDYKKAIMILEDLAARGLADTATGGKCEVYLYLARSWHAEKMYARSAVCALSYIRERPDDGSGWFFLGRAYLADGSCEKAVHALQKSIQRNPESVDARTLLGFAYLRSRKPSLAKAVFEEALSLAPEDPRLNQGYLNALFVEAVRTFRKGDAETARQMLTFLINNDIDGVVPRLYLAHALRSLGYYPESLSQYESAIEFAPEDVALRWYPVSILLEMGETEKAGKLMASFGEAAGTENMSDQMVNLLIIKNHLEETEWANAAQAALSYIKLYGSDAQVHALMGEAQRNLGNREKSFNHFTRALDLDKNNPAPHYGILMLFLASHDWKSLRGALLKAEKAGCEADTIRYYRALCDANLDSDPMILLPELQNQVLVHGAVPELVVALGRTYFRLGFSDLAVGWYEKAISLEPDNEDAWLGLIACNEDAPEDSLATEGLRKAYAGYLLKWGDNVSIRRDFVSFLIQAESWEEAADHSEILKVMNPAVAVSDRHIALFRRKAGQYRKAAILYRDLLRKKNDDKTLLANLVFCLDRMGETDSALRLMKEANRAFKPDADSLLIEGLLHERANDTEAALVVFRKVVDAFPRDARGWKQVARIYEKKGVSEMAATYAEKARDLEKKKK